MRLLFLQDVPNLARAGEVREVADGYGRNYLLPRKLAVMATPAELKRLEAQRQIASQRQVRSREEAQALAAALERVPLVFKVRAGGKDRLYGSITNSNIAQEIERLTGHRIDRRKIELPEPIRELGHHRVSVKLAKDVEAKIEVFVEEG